MVFTPYLFQMAETKRVVKVKVVSPCLLYHSSVLSGCNLKFVTNVRF